MGKEEDLPASDPRPLAPSQMGKFLEDNTGVLGSGDPLPSSWGQQALSAKGRRVDVLGFAAMCLTLPYSPEAARGSR